MLKQTYHGRSQSNGATIDPQKAAKSTKNAFLFKSFKYALLSTLTRTNDSVNKINMVEFTPTNSEIGNRDRVVRRLDNAKVSSN